MADWINNIADSVLNKLLITNVHEITERLRKVFPKGFHLEHYRNVCELRMNFEFNHDIFYL